MHNDQPDSTRQELYVVEVNGVKKSEHRIFIDALKCGMESQAMLSTQQSEASRCSQQCADQRQSRSDRVLVTL
jgi:hypothetical protein